MSTNSRASSQRFRIDNIPAELRARPQWVLWRSEVRDGKATKVPYQARQPRRRAQTDNPRTWAKFSEAVAACASGAFDGVGYVFFDADPFVGIDFDSCIHGGVLHAEVGALVLALNSYAELSPSGLGVKVIVRGSLNGHARHRTNATVWGGNVEVYETRRFFTLTGNLVRGAPSTIEDRQAGLEQVLGRVFSPKTEPERSNVPQRPAPGDLDDEELIERARDAQNGPKFERLWAGDTSDYGGDHSATDLALCDLLAFWTGGDQGRMDSLFRSSGLMRDKWDQRRGEVTYGALTMAKALEGARNHYKPEQGGELAKPPREQGPICEEAEVALPALAELLGAMVTFVRRFVVSSDAQAETAALFAAHTWTFGAADSTPYLSITSAEKRSGKTRLLEVLELLVARPWLTGRVSAAVLARKVDAELPTLLLDESDAAFKSGAEYAEALRGILNTGHRRGGKTSLCVRQGSDFAFRDFSTFGPKVLAGIGDVLPDTVSDRSIPIRLERKAPHERTERLRRSQADTEAEPLRGQLERWGATSLDALVVAEPALPEELDDRAQDGWEPLLAIADLAGGDWPERARHAARELSAGEEREDDSLGVRLLADLRNVFDTRDVDKLSSTDLVAALLEHEDAPWGELRGKPLGERALSGLLKRYRIKPKVLRFGDRTARGYEREWFENVWTRYLRPLNRNERNNGSTMRVSEDSRSVTEPSVLRSENDEIRVNQADVADVTDRSGETDGEQSHVANRRRT